jgi:hypothetical protein
MSAPGELPYDVEEAIHDVMARARDHGIRPDQERPRSDVATAGDASWLPGFKQGPTPKQTQELIEHLDRRTPEAKAETAARMDAVASAVLGLPLDAANGWLNPSAAAANGAPVTTLAPGDRNHDDKPPVSAADSFLSGDADQDEVRTARYFTSRYDGDCDTCGTHFDAGDSIRADGAGGWEGEECCGEVDDDPEDGCDDGPARAAKVAAKPKAVSLQLPVVNGRYAAPHPQTGKRTKFTRTTTFAEAVADSIALDQWKGRMTAMGLALRPDLIAKVASAVQGRVPYEVAKLERVFLNGVVEDAKLAAGSKDRAKKGTILHKHTEEIDSGRRALADVPEEYRPDVAAYLAEMARVGLRPVAGMIERSVLTRELGVVGTFDRVLEVIRPQGLRLVLESGEVVQLTFGDHVIGDVKSGAQLDYAWSEIEIQLSIYAHAVNENGVAALAHDEAGNPVWSWSSLADLGLPRVREDVAIVMHMPYSEARCDLYPADLAEGWRGAKLCKVVRDWRKIKMPQAPISVEDVGGEDFTSAPGNGFPIGAEHDTVTGVPAAVLAAPVVAEAVRRAPEAFRKPTAAQLAGYKSVVGEKATLPVETRPTVADWEAKFQGARTREEASAAWKAAKEAGLPAEVIKSLVALVDLSAPKPEPAPVVAPAPEPPKAPTWEEIGAAVTSREEASKVFTDMRAQAEEIGLPRLNAVVKIMQDVLARAV